jgi:Fe(3+) dicitrate transport protein
MRKQIFALTGATLLLTGTAIAEDADSQSDTEYTALDTVTVLGDHQEIDEIPGSAQLIGPTELNVFDYSDINRVLRSVPGVYIQEEEGLGLRPNIGIRGSGQDRSSRITLMEDGVLIAPAPYAAPAAYYFPTQRRMHAVEVLKGPAAVTEGPRTVGGAINMISTPIPESASGRAEMLFGNFDTLDLYANYGSSSENFGWVLETVQQDSTGFKKLPNGGDTGTQLEDYMAKFRINTSPGAEYAQALELKLGRTLQDGNETYLGLTDADFAADPYQRYAGSQRDNIMTEHEQKQLTWTLAPANGNWDLAVVAYRNDFARNWFKLGSVNGTGISSLLADPTTYATEMSWVRGATSPDDAFNLRNNNREYYAQGIQTELGFDFMTGDVSHALEIGVRVHEDEVDRLQDEDLFRMDNGSLVLTTDGVIGSQANRVGRADATALFVRDVIRTGDWQFTPGFRYEDIDLVREDYSTADPSRSLGPTQVRSHNVSAFIPGVGVTWRMNDEWRLLGGVHKGFNPPGPGSDSDIEESLNIEFGARYRNSDMFAEAIAFVTDYSNMVGTCTASTGGGCTIGDQFDGGEATVNGLELRTGTDFSVGGKGMIPLTFAWTWTATAEFDNSFSSGFGPWGNVNSGDEMPYTPEHQFQVLTGYVYNGLDIGLAATYVDETRTVAGSGNIAANESTDSYLVLDLSVSYALTSTTDAFLRVDNLLDEEYIVARAPAGVRPGKPRAALVGLRFDF